MKDECLCKVITTCHFEQNNWTVKIKCGDYNHLPTLGGAHATH